MFSRLDVRLAAKVLPSDTAAWIESRASLPVKQRNGANGREVTQFEMDGRTGGREKGEEGVTHGSHSEWRD